MIATRIQEFQDELDTIQLPAMTKSEMLDQMIGDVRHIQSTIDCMHGMLEALLAVNGIEVEREDDLFVDPDPPIGSDKDLLHQERVG